jgi:hypothetical protein
MVFSKRKENYTGKYLSEALILAFINPLLDNRYYGLIDTRMRASDKDLPVMKIRC